MVTIGIKVERMLPMNRKMMAMTIAAAATSVLATSRIEARMNSVEIVGDGRVEAGRQPRLDAGHHRRMPSITVSGLASGVP